MAMYQSQTGSSASVGAGSFPQHHHHKQFQQSRSGNGGEQHSTLASLLEQSQRLTTQLSTPQDLPQIVLGLDQIESQSRRIAGRSAKEAFGKDGGSGTSGNAYYLLAAGGVNADALSQKINNVNLTNTFEPLIPLSENDVPALLRHNHEQAIISAIEEGRRKTNEDFYKNLDKRMRASWERQKEKLFEELGRHQAGSNSMNAVSTPSASQSTPRRIGAGGGYDRGSPAGFSNGTTTNGASSLQMHSKMMRYDRVIRRLNEYRKQGYAFGIISSLGEACMGTTGTAGGNESKGAQLAESWRLAAHLVQERDVLNGEFQRTALNERKYAAAYLVNPDSDSQEAIEVRRIVRQGAKQYLEEQFMGHVERLLASKPAEAGLGGVPSLQNKMRAYLNVKYQKLGNWTNSSLEIVTNTPIWAHIYYLLRCGHEKEALEFAVENETGIQKLEKNFVPYFKAWLDSSDRRLPKLLRDRFLSEYNQRIRYLTDTSDPYKHALYKLIGRVELTRRNVPGVTQTTEDWLWFQLSMVREWSVAEQGGEAPHERYGLRDLGKVLVKFGEGHFDPKGNRPVLYFQVLLLSGEFERAIAFLHQHSQYQADAVHFAIAFSYYGLLRIAPRSKPSDVELLSVEENGAGIEVGQLNFARLLHRYTRSFAQSDAQEALQYLYLICLNADLPSPRGDQQVTLCHDYIKELVMETRQYADLLGDVRNDGTKIAGMLEHDLKLIHLKDEKSYLLGIVKAAAHRADQEHRFSEAVLLYNLAEEYDSVISVLNIELGNSLSRPSTSIAESEASAYFKPSSESLSMAAGQEDVANVARSILEHYDRSSGIGGRVSRKNRETCEVLMKLREAMILYGQQKLDAALATIEAVNIIPLHADLVGIIRSAEDFKELDESVAKNFDVVLLTTMNVIYKLHTQLKESPYGDASRQQKMMDLRQKARSLMMFAGMLRYRLTSETYLALTRLDVFVH